MTDLQELPLEKSTKILFNLLQVRVFDLSQTLQVTGHKLSINQLKENLEKQHNIFGQTQKIFHELNIYKLYELMKQVSQNYISIASILIDQKMTSINAKYKNVTIDVPDSKNDSERSKNQNSKDAISRRTSKRKATRKKTVKVSEEFTENEISSCIDNITNQSAINHKKLGGIHLFNENYVRGIESIKNKWEAIEAKRRKAYNQKQLLKDMIYREMTEQVEVEKIHENDEVSKFIKDGKIKHELYYHIEYEKDLQSVSVFLKQSQEEAMKFLTDTKKANSDVQNEDDIIINYHELIEILSQKKKSEFNMIENKIKQIVDAFKIKMDYLDTQIQIKDANIRELKYLLKRKEGKEANTQTVGLRHNLNLSSTSLTVEDMEEQHKAIVEMLRKNIDSTQKELLNLETDVRVKDQAIKKKDNEISLLEAEIQKYKKTLKEEKQKNIQILKEKSNPQNPTTVKDLQKLAQNQEKADEGSIYGQEYGQEEEVLKSSHRRKNKMMSGQFSTSMIGSAAGQYRAGRQNSFLSSGFADYKRMNSFNQSQDGSMPHGYNPAVHMHHASQYHQEYVARMGGGEEYRGNDSEEVISSERRHDGRNLSSYLAKSMEGGSRRMVSQGSSSDKDDEVTGTLKKIDAGDYQKSNKMISMHRQKYAQSSFTNSPYANSPYANSSYMNSPHANASYLNTPYGHTPYANSSYANTPHVNTPHGHTSYVQTPHGHTPYGQTPYGYTPYSHSPDDLGHNYREGDKDFRRYAESPKLSGYRPSSILSDKSQPKSLIQLPSKNSGQIFQNTLSTQRDPQFSMSAHNALKKNAEVLYDAIFSCVDPVNGQPFIIQDEINKIKHFMSRYNQRQVQNKLRRMISFLNLSEHTEQIVETQVCEEQDTVQNGRSHENDSSDRNSFNRLDIPAARDSVKDKQIFGRPRQGKVNSNKSFEKDSKSIIDSQSYREKKNKKLMPSSYFLNKLHAKIRVSGKGLNLSKAEFLEMCKDISVEQSSFAQENSNLDDSDEENNGRTLSKQSTIIKYKSRDFLAGESIYKTQAEKKNSRILKTKGHSVQERSKQKEKIELQSKKITKNTTQTQKDPGEGQYSENKLIDIKEARVQTLNDETQTPHSEVQGFRKSDHFSITKELQHQIRCTNPTSTLSSSTDNASGKKKQIKDIMGILKSQGAKVQSLEKLEQMMNTSKISLDDLLKITNSLKSQKTQEFMSLFSHQCDKTKSRTNPKSFHIESCCSHAKRYEAFLEKLCITQNSIKKLKKDLLNMHIFNIDGNPSQKDFSKKKITTEKSYKMIDLTNMSSTKPPPFLEKSGQLDSFYAKRNAQKTKQKKSGSKYLTKKATVSAYVEAKLKTQTETEEDVRRDAERKSVGNCNSKDSATGFLPQLTKKGVSQVIRE